MSVVGGVEPGTETLREAQVGGERRDRSRLIAILTAYWGQLTLVLLIALLARLFILITSHGMMDGDEAVLGIQAEQILRGAHPIYFAGQAYMGSWDAYLAAPLVALMGPSAWSLHLVTLAESLALVPLLGALAARLYGSRARLPAMLLAAIPPEYVAVGELRMLGGYVETLVLGTALLLLATQVAARWSAGWSTRWQWLLIGLLTGLALWIDVLIAYYLVAGFLWLLPHAIRRARDGWRGAADGRRRLVLGAIVTTLLSGAAMLLGAFPAVVYALQNNFVNVTTVTGHPAWLNRVSPVRGSVLLYLLTHDLPSVFGLRLLWHTPQTLAFVLQGMAGICAVAALAVGISRVLAAQATRRTTRTLIAHIWAHWNDVLPFLLLGAIVVLYWRSSNTALVYTHPAQDAGGRYALPATTALSLLLARLFVSLPSRSWPRGIRSTSGRIHLTLAPTLLALLLVVYAIPYAVSDNVSALQSPEAHGMVFPAEDTGLLTYLTQHHIEYMWANSGICHLVMYLEDQRVTCGEYVDVYVLQHAPNRFPEAMAATFAADRPSFIINADPSNGEPAVEQALDRLGVTYSSARFGALWVITPLSRTVQPQEIAQALAADF